MAQARIWSDVAGTGVPQRWGSRMRPAITIAMLALVAGCTASNLNRSIDWKSAEASCEHSFDDCVRACNKHEDKKACLMLTILLIEESGDYMAWRRTWTSTTLKHLSVDQIRDVEMDLHDACAEGVDRACKAAALLKQRLEQIVAEETATKNAADAAKAAEVDAAKAVDAAKKKAQVEKAEKEAEQQAEKEASAKAKEAHTQALIDEAPKVKMAISICSKDPKSCKDTCDKKGEAETTICLGYGWVAANAKPPKFADARDAYAKACNTNMGSVTACDWKKDLDRQEKAYEDEVNSLWSDVERAGDSIAEKRYLHAFATTKLPQTPKNVKAAQNVQIHIKAIIAEQFCPARKEFIAKAGIADYQARAKDHCKTNAPVGTGLGGVPVTLTAECNAAFATACP